MDLIHESELRTLILDGRHDEFNELAAQTPPDLAHHHLRGLDLRAFDLSRADLRGAYLRNADLRGVDLRQARLDGATLRDAKLSGAWLPPDIHADEIQLSTQTGTRLRSRP